MKKRFLAGILAGILSFSTAAAGILTALAAEEPAAAETEADEKEERILTP